MTVASQTTGSMCSASLWVCIPTLLSSTIRRPRCSSSGVLTWHLKHGVVLQILASELGSALLVRSACTLLRQLANSDAIKTEIVENNGLDLFCRAVDAHISNGGKLARRLLCCTLLCSVTCDFVSNLTCGLIKVHE